ncbi:MAG: hypothetical protein N3E45_01450 [Oscillatoriaceae bacterium SKW80]|nr:hypothetical protein [Oscillatoriaceae bacterium SKYG93]MCX8119494.1 hypothetical protein [Oscillatoriaceae bacterium SKW80]MDW8454961.1 hypothetical protein [Oscillatoriaceae cyanobacterium SKYGB_i_bin93]HIK28260.1 hypothetical protein [Oscillatoriaceae cyanobacterium M7585_C2015_266]
MTSQSLELARTEYKAGRAAFESGSYRQSVQHLVKASALLDRNSRFGGEVQIWLVTAYEAAGQRSEAIALCKILTNHPHLETRKQSRRLLYILEAPKLKTRPEWLLEIPDLSRLEQSESNFRQVSALAKTKPFKSKPPQSQPEPIDLSQVNTKDNRFVWLALIVTILTLGSLLWLS